MLVVLGDFHRNACENSKNTQAVSHAYGKGTQLASVSHMEQISTTATQLLGDF